MIKEKIISFSDWISRNQKVICIVIISLSLLRFIQLNYVNWEYGKLCSGTGGIQYAYDSSRLMDGAERLINNEPLRRIQLPYISYILLIALFFKLKIGLEALLIIQLLAALMASFALYDFGRLITNSRLTGVIASSLVLINPFIVQWHLFIHTDSIYSSCLIISLWLIYKTLIRRTFRFYLLSIIISVFTILLRPNGWLIVPAAASFIAISLNIKKLHRILILICPVIIIAVAVNTAFFNKLLDDYYVKSYNRGKVIIFKDPRFNNSTTDTSQLNESSKFFLGYDLQSPKTFIKRIFAELFPVYRPWTSFRFILRFLIWMLPIYILSLLGIFYLFRDKGFLFALLVILLQLFMVGMTYANNESRFLVQILPVFILLCSCGMHSIWKRIQTYPPNKA